MHHQSATRTIPEKIDRMPPNVAKNVAERHTPGFFGEVQKTPHVQHITAF